MEAEEKKKDKFPIESKSITAIIQEIKTEIILTRFGDRIFIIITQLGKIGTVIEATKESVLENEGTSTFSVDVLLGKRDEESLIQLYARQLIELISKTSKTTILPLLLSVALKNDKDPKTFKEILTIIYHNRVW